MTLATRQSVVSRRGGLGRYPRQQSTALAVRRLPEYLEQSEVQVLLATAPTRQAALLMLIQWRAGLRVSEALSLERRDLHLDSDRPTLVVRLGKGKKTRIVPVHPELRAALSTVLSYIRVDGRLVEADPSTAWRWVKQAQARAVALGSFPPGRHIGTHTLRHSAARHWLASGIPINVVSRWLGHASLQTTLIYLEILPDPLGDMERVP